MYSTEGELFVFIYIIHCYIFIFYGFFCNSLSYRKKCDGYMICMELLFSIDRFMPVWLKGKQINYKESFYYLLHIVYFYIVHVC